jgi:GAF domain-containing protein
LRAKRGVPKGQRAIRQNIGEGIVGLAAEIREPVLVHDVTAGKWANVYKQVILSTRSELAVPLVDESGLLGVINVEHPEAGAFSKDDQALLEALAVQAVTAIHSVELYQKLERQIQSLRALSDISIRIQDRRYTLDTVLRLLLTGVTAGEGLEFSRAMLFLADNEMTKLQGKMAIGAQTREEAESIWKRLDEEVNSLGARENILPSLLDQAEEFSIAVMEEEERDWPLSTAMQSVCIPIERDAGALSVCLQKGDPVIVEDAQPDPFRETIEQITQPGDMGRAFVCVPLLGKGGPTGALVVDNRFLMSEREIDEDAIDCLEAFAGVMAMSIENARLQTRLAEEQRLATWKEFTVRIAHIIGTRTAVIEGALTRIRFCLLEKDAVKVEHLRKAQIALKEFREFTAPLELRFDQLDLTKTLRATIQEIRHSVDCPIELVVPEDPLILQGDPNRLSDAFIELIRNAHEAMQQDTGRLPLITITAGLEAAPAGPRAVARIEFANTGPGIPEADKKHIFEPFFSTKGKGSGLGLAIVKNIIEEHEGTIEEIGIPEAGARFIVRLPTIESKPHLEQKGGRNGQDSRSGR